MKNVTLSGGCFYNVKLNNSVLKNTNGFVCVIPLAGDQGAAIGMYAAQNGFFNFYDLCYGKRDFEYNKILDENSRIMFFATEEAFVEKAVELLNEDKIVNIVNREMEFGPRALCNTSTLALPTQRNVDYINYINDRNTVMPMAPVVLYRNVLPLFDDKEMLDRVIGSNDYMIMTHDFSKDAVESDKYEGVMHIYPDKSGFSGRPQIVHSTTEKPIGKILDKVNALCLINTSFNTHGTPILFSAEDCINDFRKQCKKDRSQCNYLLILDA
jgi:carbamoyltransferase